MRVASVATQTVDDVPAATYAATAFVPVVEPVAVALVVHAAEPAVTCAAPAPVIEDAAPASAVTNAARAPVIEYVAPTPAVTCEEPAQVIEHVGDRTCWSTSHQQ